MTGKAPPETLLDQVFTRTGTPDDSVLQGPAVGEDAAAIDLESETLVVSSDPISLAASQVGKLGVHIACNDVAVSGVEPRWLTVVLILPDEMSLEPIMEDIDTAATALDVAVVGGHTEYLEAIERPMASLTAMGTGSFLPTSGAKAGDEVVLTKGAGIEGTAILAADFGEELDVDQSVIDAATGFFEEISVVPEARLLREVATAMHDPTEGGIAAGLHELARAADVRIDVDRDRIPLRSETIALTEAAGVDPVQIFGSGALLATIPPAAVDDALAELEAAGIEAARIGTVADGSGELVIDGATITGPVHDDLYPLWERKE